MHKINIEYISSAQINIMTDNMRHEGTRLLSINAYIDINGVTKVIYNFEISKENVKTYICRVDGEMISIKDCFGEFAAAYEQEIMEIIPLKFIGVEEKSMFLSKDSNLRGQLFTVPVLEEENKPMIEK